jgi:thioredoxin 1
MHDWTPQELEKQLESGKSVFLKLWKRGCGSCKLSTPAVERIEAADQLGLVFAQINVDEHPEMLEIADTENLPAFFVFKDKAIAARQVGFKGLERLKALLTEAFG